MSAATHKNQTMDTINSLVGDLAQAVRGLQEQGYDMGGEAGWDGWVDSDEYEDPSDFSPGPESYQLQNGHWATVNTGGTFQLENAESGIIYQENPDGSALVSLPDGRFMRQDFKGDPWLLHNPYNENAYPIRVEPGRVQMPGEVKIRNVYTFRDEAATHVIDAETLQYYVARRGYNTV